MDIPPDTQSEELVGSYLPIILKRSDNAECMDCCATAPKWAVVNWGIFVCIRCSGMHRNLGTHISKVKSCNLDKWTVDEVRWMEKMGNARAKKILEARSRRGGNVLGDHTPNSEIEVLIKAKYIGLEMCHKTKKPPTMRAWLKREAKKGTSKSKKEKKSKRTVVSESESEESEELLTESSSSPVRGSPNGVFGQVTGDPSTLDKRRNELLSLFS